MKRDRIDSILQEKLRGYPSPVEVPSWSEMERKLILARNELGMPRRREQPWKKVMHYGVAASILVLLSIGIYRFEVSELQKAADDSLKLWQEVSPALTDRASGQHDRSERPVETILRSASKVSIVRSETHQERLDMLAHIAQVNTSAEDDASQSDAPESGAGPGGGRTYASDNRQQTTGNRNYFRYGEPDNATRKRKDWIATAFTGGGIISSQKGTANATPGMFSYRAALVQVSNLNLQSDYITTEWNHKLPITVGLNIQRYLTDRFAVETGVIYSYLLSTGRETRQFFEYRIRQQVHYLGVPVSFSYDLVRNNRWNLYVAGGGAVEFALAARKRIDIDNTDNYSTWLSEPVPMKGVLGSLRFGAGVEYKFLGDLGIYAEPGINYYFPNTNQPVTYWTENPWSFNLRVGLRMRF